MENYISVNNIMNVCGMNSLLLLGAYNYKYIHICTCYDVVIIIMIIIVYYHSNVWHNHDINN